MKTLKATTIILMAILLSSCTEERFFVTGEGPIISEEIILEDISKIDLSGASDITISYGATQEIIAIGQSNIISRVSTRVHNGTWDATLERGRYRNYDLSFHVTLPLLEAVKISGSGNVDLNDFENQSDLNLTISGSGNIKFSEIDGLENLTVRISGSGNISALKPISALNAVNIKIDGSGNYSGYQVASSECVISNSGSGDCKVTVYDTLNATITGSGNVSYKGNPQIFQKIEGSGKVINAN